MIFVEGRERSGYSRPRNCSYLSQGIFSLLIVSSLLIGKCWMPSNIVRLSGCYLHRHLDSEKDCSMIGISEIVMMSAISDTSTENKLAA